MNKPRFGAPLGAGLRALFAATLFATSALADSVPLGPSGGGGGGGGSGTVTSVSASDGLLSVGTPTTTPALTVAGASGGVPYFNSASTWASSAALAANSLMIGGGAGVAPSTVTTNATVLTALGSAPTGSGGLVLATSPTLVTPVLGAATATSLAIGGATLGSNAISATGSIATTTFMASVGSFFGTSNASTYVLGSSNDTFLSRHQAAGWQFGQADTPAPTAQSTFVTSVSAGTSNTAGANWTLDGSVSTGSGLSGDIVFKTGGTGAGATVQNAEVTALTIKGATQNVVFAAGLVSSGTLPTLTTGTCSGSSAAGGSLAGTFVAATCAAGTYILSGLPTAPTGYSCNAEDRTTTTDTLQQTATSTTSATFKATTAASDVVQFNCLAY